MTDVNQQPEQAQPQGQIPPMNPQQIEAVKRALIDNLNKAYLQFMNVVCQLPCEVNGLKNAIFFFDTGIFWFEKAISKMPVNPLPVTPQQQANPGNPPQEPQEPSKVAETPQEPELMPPAA